MLRRRSQGSIPRDRFWLNWILGILLFTLGLSLPRIEAEVGDWSTITNANFIQDVHLVGDDLWCATSGGVLRLDIAEERIEKFTNVDGLGHIDVLALSVDDLGKLWFGTNGGGLSTFHPTSGRWQTYTEFDGVAGKVVGAVLASCDRIWIGTEEGISLFVWNQAEGDFFWKENYLAERRVPVSKVRTFLDWNDEIYVGMEGGIARARYYHPDFVPNLQDSASWINYDESHGLTHNQVNCFALAGHTIVVGTNDGVSAFVDSTWVSWSGDLAGTVVYDLLVNDLKIWAGTDAGLYMFDIVSPWEPNPGWIPILEGEAITALAMHDSGALWVGTERAGVMVEDGEDWIRYITDGPASNNIERVVLDHAEHIWVSTVAPGYIAKACRLADDQWIIFDESDGLETGARLLGLFEDHLGRKWFGSWGDGVGILDDHGTLTKDDDLWLHLDEENSGLKGIIQNPLYVVVTEITQDQNRNYWFTNFSGVESGLVVCDSTLSQWTAYSVRDGLVFPEVQSLAIDQQGIKWVGALQEGMSRFDDAGTPFDKQDDDSLFAWQTFSESSSNSNYVIASDNVTSICVDKQGVVWIGTAAGIMKYNSFYFSEVTGLLNESVNVVAADARDNIWVGTNGGVSLLETTGDIWTHFTTTNSGLVSDKVQDVAINERTGEVWLATDLGLSRYQSGIISPVSTMDAVTAYPNPFFPEKDDGLVTFDGLADASTVFIFNLAGELIREIPMPDKNLNRASWDGKNAHGADVASGVYIFLVYNEDGLSKVGKIALVR